MLLSDHKITKVTAGLIRNMWPRVLGRNGKSGGQGYGLGNNYVVIIETDTGYMGWGYGHADTTLKLFLEGKKLSDVFSPEIGILYPWLRAADIALHDLAGNILGMPVSKMINPDSAMKISCYDGAIYMSDMSDKGDLGVDIILENCEDDYQAGYRDFKVKIGRGKLWMGREEGLKRDVDIIRAIRRKYPKSKILVDANDSMDLNTIIAFMEQVKDCSIYWIEEPFVENYDDCAALKEYLSKESPNTLLADGEYDHNADYVIGLAKKGVLDVLIMDVESFSVTSWRKLFKECGGTNIKCSPHTWGTKLKENVVAHLTAACPELCPFIEGVPDRLEGVDVSGYTMENGIVLLPEKSGFGMTLEYARPVEIYKPY